MPWPSVGFWLTGSVSLSILSCNKNSLGYLATFVWLHLFIYVCT